MLNKYEILFFGDFYPCNRVKQLIENKEWSRIFSNNWDPILTDVDLRIINLEAPAVAADKATPLYKIGRNLSCTENAIKLLKYKGFDLFTLANNHFFDYMDHGVSETLKLCRENNIDYVGGGMNLNEAVKPYRKNIKGKIFSVINICENEFSVASAEHGGAAPLDLPVNYNTICEERKSADYVIVVFHGGLEHYNLPSPQMKKICHFFVDAGVNAVVCHHTHCFSGHELYKNVPIFYGLGNCSFDLQQDESHISVYGFALKLIFSDSGVDFILYPYIQGATNPGVELLTEEKELEFQQKIKKLNCQLIDDEFISRNYVEHIKSKSAMWLNYLEPFACRVYNRLKRCGILPSFISKRKKNYLLNIIRCETHREALLKLLSAQCGRKK